MAGNIFRGAFGHLFRQIDNQWTDCPYARIFEPQSLNGPSGFASAPRPFVLRPQDLEENRFQPGDLFCLDVHLFDLQEKLLEYFVSTFLQLAQVGLGPGRVPVELIAVRALTPEHKPGETIWNQNSGYCATLPASLQIDLHAVNSPVERFRVQFQTPTELKSEGLVNRVPEFGILFGRVRDRISALSSFYGRPLHFDFKELGERSKAVKLTDYQLKWEQAQRRSSRTGQQHLLGGFVGWAEYEGSLSEFTPWLQAGFWSGVGRQTVWGKGTITIRTVKRGPGRASFP